ncbi:MAG: T9SS type A sorting domain-containing protein [Ignavibacteriae bacterium]|nr:T9SS type A sorting domain-containing protein [Ignavibacteriota bacterium]
MPFARINCFRNQSISTDSIEFALPKQSHVKLEIFNTLSQRVTALVNETRSAGYYTENFDASGLPSGVYFYRLQAGDASTGSAQNFVSTKKLILLR